MFLAFQLYDEGLDVIIVGGEALCAWWSEVPAKTQNTVALQMYAHADACQCLVVPA